ncbi:unnamed protein product [Protopolystoma xenopodis]|uniref:Uncharacterized protein n=1 Tax=Protopolystoma xenopodis TaxID=117903 RepID=A0A448XPW5_9PLAT|nr:unnamed protein product [Protopolystoma xenopodis]
MQSSFLVLAQSLSCSVKSVCSTLRSPISLDSCHHICPTRGVIRPPPPCVWVTNSRRKPLSVMVTPLLHVPWLWDQQTYRQPTSSGPRRLYPVSIPGRKGKIPQLFSTRLVKGSASLVSLTSCCMVLIMVMLTDDAGETFGNVPCPLFNFGNDHADSGLRTRCVPLNRPTKLTKFRKQGQTTEGDCDHTILVFIFLINC